jgi:hypothetical protein
MSNSVWTDCNCSIVGATLFVLTRGGEYGGNRSEASRAWSTSGEPGGTPTYNPLIMSNFYFRTLAD